MAYAEITINGGHLYCKDCSARRMKKNTWRKSAGGPSGKTEEGYVLRDDTTHTDRCLFIGNLDYGHCSTDEDIMRLVTAIWEDKSDALSGILSRTTCSLSEAKEL